MLARTEGIAHIGSWEFDVAADKVTWSDELFRIFQMEPSDTAPSYLEHPRLFHLDDIKKLDIAVQAALRDGTPYELELRAIRLDGETRFCLSKGYSHIGQSGKVERLFGSFQDITEHKRLDHLIEKRLQLSSYAIDHSIADVLQKTLDLTEEMTGSCIGFYHYIDESEQKIILQQWSTKTVQDFCKAEGYGLHYGVGQGGVWADCIRERRPIIHNDYESLPNKKGLPMGHAKIFRELVVPIFRNDKIVAILGVGNKRQDYTEKDVELATFFADFAWDIAAHKQTEDSLLQKEQTFKNLFNNSQLAMFRTKIDGSETLEVNDKWLELVGKTRDEVIGKPSVIHWVDPDKRAEIVRILKSKGRIVNIENQMLNEKLGIRDCLTSVTYYLESGILEGTTVDITERKRMEQTLRESEERFRCAFEYAPIGVSMHELGGGFLRVNKAFCNIVGYSNEELSTRTYRDITHPDDLALNIELVRKLLSGQEKIIRFNKRYIHKLGHEVPVSIYVSVLSNESGKPLSLLSIVEDLTEKKKLEEQLRQSQKMEAIGVLAGGVAHDFNNILTAIMGFGTMAKKRIKEDDNIKLFIDEILASAKRAAELTKGLLAFSRKQVISPRVLELNGIIEGISKMLKRIIGEDIILKTSLSKDAIIVKVDSSQMEQVLLNMATNARDAMPDGGHLIIETSTVNADNEYAEMHFLKDPGQYVVLTVSDTGIGMDAKTREHIFDPFFTTKGIGKGTGLGLAVVYGIIKQHEGSITVYSEPGNGTTFKIYLPTVRMNIQEAGSIVAHEPLSGKGETLLLAEDDGSVRRVTKIILEEAGYKVIEAKNGEEALSKFVENKDSIRLLIFDVIMPVQTGKDAYNAIKKIKPEQAALFMSGYTDDIVARKGILEEGLEFISKPVQPDVLLRNIRDLLDKA
ncbi:MAG: PAS domain S-box protein [Nitrospirae bacterium]|nr:PAS domain S-box protein [Nitrospirota bacterium]